MRHCPQSHEFRNGAHRFSHRFDDDCARDGMEFVATRDTRGRAFLPIEEEPVVLRDGQASIACVQADVREEPSRPASTVRPSVAGEWARLAHVPRHAVRARAEGGGEWQGRQRPCVM
eukprot:scaffold8134_cov138-Isochrysis_galbana.AAC.3